uniref:Uncharacterized protein n=1 Tax=Lepeophtheirus salmonis TaxID=72036 RepID=A0A0K2UNK4_LEPSM
MQIKYNLDGMCWRSYVPGQVLTDTPLSRGRLGLNNFQDLFFIGVESNLHYTRNTSHN